MLVDQPQTTYSHAALAALAESDAVLVVCGRNHLPAAILLPLADHSQVVWRINEQLAVSRPLAKATLEAARAAKIRGQAANLARGTPGPLQAARALPGEVRSGDPTNLEAQAARVYWQSYLPDEVFRRDADASGLNSLLNYGYAVVRAALARAIVAAGMLPSLGLNHSNRSNAFCLADDLIEPLRPLVDDRARELYRQGHNELTTEAKAGLLSCWPTTCGWPARPARCWSTCIAMSPRWFGAFKAKAKRSGDSRLDVAEVATDETACCLPLDLDP